MVGHAKLSSRADIDLCINRHELFMHFWKGRDEFHGIVESPLIAFVKDINFAASQQAGYHYDFKVDPLTLIGYIGQVAAWMRCAWLKEPNGGFDGVDYYVEKCLLFNALEEDWGAEKTIGFKGEDLFNVLTTRRDADPDSKEYKRAYECTWRLLTNSTMQKITHGKDLMHTVSLGTLLDMKENLGKDCKEGTFGELLRYGSVHLEQTRESIVYVKPEMPDPKNIIHKGLLEE
jgi:hypothetical protein